MKIPLARAPGHIALIVGALAISAAALAQNKPRPDPADASAAFPPTRYEGFALPSPTTAMPSPTATWQALNRTVAAYDSMSLTMDAAASRPGEPAATPALAPARAQAAGATDAAATEPAGPAHPPAPSRPPDPHAHHRPGAAK